VPGIYSTWHGKDGAAQQVKGYSNALSKSFTKYKDAVKWYEKNQEDSSSELDARYEGVGLRVGLSLRVGFPLRVGLVKRIFDRLVSLDGAPSEAPSEGPS
jgi:hypothetical protein